MKARAWIFVIAFVAASATAAMAEVGYRVQNDKVSAVTNLTSEQTCGVGGKRYVVRGKVVSRKFDPNLSTMLTEITLEEPSGERTLINVDAKMALQTASRVTSGWVTSGLQILSKVGRSALVQVRPCGAAGRFLYLHEIR